MKLGMSGAGRMGGHMAERLRAAGHTVIVNSRTPATVDRMVGLGFEGAYSLPELVAKLEAPRIVWLMIPCGEPVDRAIASVLPRLEAGDILVDGGNSYYADTLRRAPMIAEAGVHFVDVGTSGGIWGETEGYSLMIGGEEDVVQRMRPIFEALAPGPERGWGRVGPSGAGHFVKMVHNGIEYGMMQSFGEGFALMARKEQFGLDLAQISQIWRFGSVVRSWLLDLLADSLAQDPQLAGTAPYVEDSGEGRWTVAEALALDQPAPVITLSLIQRLASRDSVGLSDRVVAMLRHGFGGHEFRREGTCDAGEPT
jgi:6-phosphogluconate dehydrogenase